MKICLITNLYPPDTIGGAEIYVRNIAQELALQHNVFVITTRPFAGAASLWPSYNSQDAIRVYRFFPLNLYHVGSAKRRPGLLKPLWHLIDIINGEPAGIVSDILKKERPDIVHTHNLNGLSLQVPRRIRSLGLPLIHTVHDFGLLCPYTSLMCQGSFDGNCLKPGFWCVMYRRLKKNSIDDVPDTVIFPSQSAADRYHAHKFFLRSRSIVVYGCVGLPAENVRHKTEGAFAPQAIPLNKPQGVSAAGRSGGFTILYIGQLVKHKGVQVLIEAFQGLSGANIELHIVGSGDYENALKALASGDRRIKFHGKVEHEQIAQYYRKADVTVVPSVWPEVLGIVILESFSFGVPVIGSDIGGIREVVKEGYNGFLFQTGNSNQLRELLRKSSSGSQSLESVSSHAYESSRFFSTQEHCKKLAAIYAEAINRNREKRKQQS